MLAWGDGKVPLGRSLSVSGLNVGQSKNRSGAQWSGTVPVARRAAAGSNHQRSGLRAHFDPGSSP